MEHIEKIRLPKPPKALTDAAERGGNAILRASKKLPKVRLQKPQNPFGAGTAATLRRASQAAKTMGGAAGVLAATPGTGYIGGALGGLAAGPKGAAAGFAGGAALDYAATAALGLMAGRRAKAAGYLSRRKERKDGVYKARQMWGKPMSPDAAGRRADRYKRFADASGRRPAGGKARVEIARLMEREARQEAEAMRQQPKAYWPKVTGGTPSAYHERAKLEQDRAKAKAAAARRNDKNRDGWVDGQKPKGAKPRKTATKATQPKPETTGAKPKKKKPSVFGPRPSEDAFRRWMDKQRPAANPSKAAYSESSAPLGAEPKADGKTRRIGTDRSRARHYVDNIQDRDGSFLVWDGQSGNVVGRFKTEAEAKSASRKLNTKPKETTGAKLRRASQTKIKGDPQAEHAEASRAYREALDAQQANQREGMQAAGRARRASEGSKPKAREADGAADHRGALKDHATESGRKARAAQAGPLASQAKIDREVARTGEALRRASAKLDAMKEQRRLDSMPSAEQMRADNDKMMRRRLAEIDAKLKGKGRKKTGVQPISKSFTFAFEKADVTGRYVRGWANVCEMDGEPVCDIQGDIIAMDEMRKAAHDYISNAREAKAMHDGDRIGDVVESVMIDDDFAKAHGITHGKRGWWIGMEVHDPAVRKRVASGELRSFSIGGSGKRTPMEKRGEVSRYMAKPRPVGLMGLVRERPNKPTARAARNYSAQPKGPLGLIRGSIRQERDKGLAPKRRERARLGLKVKAGLMVGALLGMGMATPNIVMDQAWDNHRAGMQYSTQLLRDRVAELRKRRRR